MWLIDQLAETRITDAIRLGQLDDLPGAGKRIPLDDAPLVAPDLRVAYRLLRMSGHMPPELTLLQEIREIEQLMLDMSAGEQRCSAVKRLNLLTTQLGIRAENLICIAQYSSKVISKLDSDAHAE